MTYAMRPVGFFGMGATAEEGDTPEEIVLRNQAKRYATRIWNDARDLRQAAGELMEVEPYSNDAFTTAVRNIVRRAADVTDIRLPRREFASLIQGAVGKLAMLQIKAYKLANSRDIRGVYSEVERINATAMRLVGTTRRVLDDARAETEEGQSGLGLFWAIPLVAIGGFVIVGSLALVLIENMEEADRAIAIADRRCELHKQQTGEPCGAYMWDQFHREARAVQRESGVESLIRDTGEGVQTMFRLMVPSIDRAVSTVTDVIIGVTIGAGVLVAGLGVWVAWPYLSGARKVGQRLESTVSQNPRRRRRRRRRRRTSR